MEVCQACQNILTIHTVYLKKNPKTIPGPLFKGHEATQEETDLDKDKKLSVGLKEQDRQQCV